MAFHESFHNGRAHDPSDDGLPEASPHEGLEHHLPPNEEKQHYPSSIEEKEYHSPTELSPNNPPVHHPSPDAYKSDPYSQPEPNLPQGKQTSWKKKRFWIPVACLLLIGVIVGGIVGGLTRKDSSHNEAPTASPGSTAASSASATSPSSTSNTPQPTSKPLNSSLASVAWSDHGEIGYRRLYYQDDAGMIKESAWNTSGNEWYSSNEALASARPNSPIAAAVAGNRIWPFVSSNPSFGRWAFDVLAGSLIECPAWT
ncbi:MAG: hypothetical protein Q9166_004721 [cf. Caloplaca sp. 2 TL-2023]